jgi:hypothetical protein
MQRIRRMAGRITSAHVIAVIALFVALGGSVYAANKISGKTVKKNSLPGNRIKKNSVTGNQVKESTLKGINATQLGGQTASAFQGRVLWAIVNGPDGGLIASSGSGITSTQDAGAAYHVHFPVSVANKAIVASPAASGFAGNGAGSMDLKVGPCPTSVNCTLFSGATNQDVSIATFVAGAPANAGFFVALIP